MSCTPDSWEGDLSVCIVARLSVSRKAEGLLSSRDKCTIKEDKGQINFSLRTSHLAGRLKHDWPFYQHLQCRKKQNK